MCTILVCVNVCDNVLSIVVYFHMSAEILSGADCYQPDNVPHCNDANVNIAGLCIYKSRRLPVISSHVHCDCSMLYNTVVFHLCALHL